MKRLVLCTAFGCLMSVASARDFGQWEGTDPQIRQWYQALMQPDNPAVSCCGEADAYWADSFEVDGDKYVAIITELPTRRAATPQTHRCRNKDRRPEPQAEI